MRNVRMLLLVVAVLALAALACSIGGPRDQPPEEAATPVPDQGGDAQSEPTPAEAAEATEAPAPAPAEQDLTLSNLTEGLAGLRSYKSAFALKFAGTDEQGQPVNLSWETHEEFIQEPRAQRVAITTSGSQAQPT